MHHRAHLEYHFIPLVWLQLFRQRLRPRIGFADQICKSCIRIHPRHDLRDHARPGLGSKLHTHPFLQYTLKLKAKGDKEADKIKKDADLKAEELQTAGRMEAGKIIGEAEQEATRIDAKANSFAPEFYSFWRSMQTLRNTLNGNATIVLRNDNEFFKMLFEEPNKGEAPASAPVQPAPEQPPCAVTRPPLMVIYP